MSKPANKTMIGIFVLGAAGLAVAAVLVLGSGKFFKMTLGAVCYFEGSVGGLNVGAPVVFRGVKVGTVADVKLRYYPKADEVKIPVFLEIEPEKVEREKGASRDPKGSLKTMIGQGLKARLEMQSIVTGQMQVGLDFYPGKPAKFVGTDPEYIEIPTIPTPLQELAKKVEQLPLEEIVKDIASAVKGIDRMVNSPEITKTVQSISRAAEETRSLVNNLNAKIDPVVTGIEGTVGDARHLLQEMDGNVGRIAAGVNDAMKDIQKLTQDAQKMIQDVQKVTLNVNDQVQPLSTNLQDTLKDAQRLLRDLDGKATALVSSLDETAKDAQKLVRNIDKQIEPLGSSVQKTLTSVEKTSDEAGATLRQAQQTLGALEGDLGEDSELVYELKKAIKGIGVAVRAIQDLAKSLDQQPESVIFGKKRLGR